MLVWTDAGLDERLFLERIYNEATLRILCRNVVMRHRYIDTELCQLEEAVCFFIIIQWRRLRGS